MVCAEEELCDLTEYFKRIILIDLLRIDFGGGEVRVGSKKNS